eukprot:TRINITY_DN10205_c0_g1_i1.p1 TRINITY_DN10205_c0_g1~~TRINITY_DN10205_c0_g1_i1.p1  ORF type:complete len:218 (-),score=60.00 TRINITY_DN10205_c0_g1_i1:65-718(-)
MSSNLKLVVKGLGMSTCARRVFTTCEETGTPYEISPVNFATGEHKSEAYREKYQPFGVIPVLIDGDFQVYESRAICRYVANAYDREGKLYPADPKTRALVDQWVDVSATNYGVVDQLVGEAKFKPMFGRGDPDPVKVQELEGKVKEVFGILDKHFAKGSQYFVGNTVTIADIAFAPYTEYLVDLPQYKNLLDEFPNFKAWWTRFSSRPSWQKVRTLQ